MSYVVWMRLKAAEQDALQVAPEKEDDEAEDAEESRHNAFSLLITTVD